MSNDFLNHVFSYYDTVIQPLPVGYQALLSLALLIFLVWNIYAFLKSGNWILIAILILALPGTWPAARNIAGIVWLLFRGLFYRISGQF